MAFDSRNSPTEDELHAEELRQEALDNLQKIPRALRFLLNRSGFYTADMLLEETVKEAPQHRRLIMECHAFTIRTAADHVVGLAHDELVTLLEDSASETKRDLALCWRMIGGRSSASADLRYELGHRLVACFDDFVASGKSRGIGLRTACELMIAVSAWSMACHRGYPQRCFGSAAEGLLPAAEHTADGLAEAGAMLALPQSLSVDNSVRHSGLKVGASKEKGPLKPRTWH